MKKMQLIVLLTFILSKCAILAHTTTTYTFIPMCFVNATVAPLSNTTDCFSFQSYTASTSPPDSYFVWNFGDGSPTETGKNLNHCYAAMSLGGNPTKTVTLTYTDPALNCHFVQTYTLNVSIEDFSICPNTPPSFSLTAKTVTVYGGIAIPEMQTAYDYGDGTPQTTTNVHTYTVCGNYIVHVSTWDMNQPGVVCDSYAAINISCEQTSTGISENNNDVQITLFPNPSTDVLNVVSDIKIKSIKIIDILGNELITKNDIHTNQLELSLYNISAGTYFLNITLTNQLEKNSRFIKN